MAGIVSSGIGSGLDVAGLVNQLLSAEAQPAEVRFARKEAGVLAKISGYSAVKSALSAFQTQVDKFKDEDSLLGRTVSFVENDFFSASVADDASPAEFDLNILSLAQSQKLATGSYVDSGSVVGDGQLVISSGDESFVVAIDPAANTLADIQDAINNNPGNTSVRATIVTTDAGASLSFSALETGLASRISIVASGGDGGLSALEYNSATSTGALTEVRPADDATVEIDGLTVTSSSNTISNAVQGVTIELTAADPGSLKSVSVDYDRPGLSGRLQKFADAYNNLVDVFNQQTAFNAEAETAGALLGDTTLRNIESQIRREFSTTVSSNQSALNTLSSVGLTLDLEGKLSIDSEKLDAAVGENFLEVGRLFSAEDGVASRISTRLESYLGDAGPLETRTDGLNDTIEQITEQRERLQERLVLLESRLLRQFNALDSLIGELSNTSSFLTQQLSALPGANNNSR